GLRDTSSQTSALTFANNEFAEFEFAIEPTTQAVEGTTYCFRVSDSGTALRNYDVYAEGTVSADITVSATSTQVSTLDLGTTAQYVGGGFVFQRSGTSRTLTSITVTETGTVDAGEHLRNPRLYYDIDTTSPYDCTGETYAPSDGFVSGSPFTGPDGSTTFTGSVALNSTQSFCGYLVVDIAATSTNGETINVEISDPSTEVVVTSSTVGPSTAVSPTGSTTIAGPILTQTGFHWRNDDGVESGATSATGGSEDTALQNVPRDTIYRLRLLVSNEGAVTSASTQYQVEYGTKITTCADVGSWQAVDSGVAFTMGSTSQLVDGNNTTDIAVGIGGVTNPGGKTLLASNGGQKEVDDQTSGVALTSAQFVELEYALEVTDQSGYDTTYCFRVTDAGTPLPAYDTYAELTTRKKQDFFVQRGTEIVSGTGTVMIAGVHYTAPAATNTAFVRITTSQLTGAGNNTGGGNQNADDVTAHIEYLTDITDSFSIVRPSTATGVTRVDWELVEYVGLEGADNEIIVRDVGTINYGTASLSVTGGLSSGVVDDGDIAVFITGQSNNAANATSYAAGQSTAAWNAGADRPVFTRASNGVTGEVSYAVVEFIGLNWDVQRTEHNYAASGVTETNSITAVNSLSRAFVHAQKRHSNEANLDAYGHKVWLSSIGAVSFRLNSGAGTPGDHYSVAWVIENKQTGTGEMNVYRDEDSVDGSEAVEPRTSVFNFNGTVSSMSNASLFISNDSTGNGTAFPRAMLGASVTSTTQYEIFESDAGQTQDFHVAVVEWPVAEVTFAQNYYRFYADNDTLTPTDPWPIGGV
ncbi:hypothetical protein KC906_01135, partial [Candidatus Kaiserbacteria bacterium]|nr:hypothetical protein [Candidatus Kaiserbacteria bacterium]